MIYYLGLKMIITFKFPGERILWISEMSIIINECLDTVIVPRSTARSDEGGPVLLDGGLHNVGGHRLSDQVHQGVRRCNVTGVDLLAALKQKFMTSFEKDM